MRLAIQGLSEIRARLAAIRAEDIMAAALAEQAERLAQAVRDGLATPPGAGNHDRPWSRTGALHDSIAVQSNGLEAAIGSNDPAAAPQEMGTLRMPPRPFLAPVAASMGEEVARGVAEPVVAALKGETVSTSNKGRTQTVPYNPLGVFLPGSPENEEWARNTARGIMALGWELGEYFTRSSSLRKRTLSPNPLHPAWPNQPRQPCPKTDADTFWTGTKRVAEVMVRAVIHRTRVTFPRTGQTIRPSKP